VSESSPRFRSILDQFVPYKPGRIPVREDGRSHKLSSNESPFGPLSSPQRPGRSTGIPTTGRSR
jgi:histidinol-phosphate aminotransferase